MINLKISPNNFSCFFFSGSPPFPAQQNPTRPSGPNTPASTKLSAAKNTDRKLLVFFNSPFSACQASFMSNTIIVTGAFAFS